MLPLLIGTSCILAPPPIALGVAGTTLATQGVRAGLRHRRRKDASASGQPDGWQAVDAALEEEAGASGPRERVRVSMKPSVKICVQERR